MDFNITNFNERLKSIKLRELIVAGIGAIILGVILSEIFPAIYDSDDLYFVVITILILVFFIYTLKGTYGLKTNIHSVLKLKIKEIIYVFLINIFLQWFSCIIFQFRHYDWIFRPQLGNRIWIWLCKPHTNCIFIDALGTIILAPIVEELVFRGVLLNRLKLRIGIIPAILVSSFLFGIGHEFGGMISAFLFGICMCILYLKTDNILIPITVHFINNLVVTLLESTHIDTIMLEFPWIIPTLIICLISSVLLILYIYKGFKKVKTLT